MPNIFKELHHYIADNGEIMKSFFENDKRSLSDILQNLIDKIMLMLQIMIEKKKIDEAKFTLTPVSFITGLAQKIKNKRLDTVGFQEAFIACAHEVIEKYDILNDEDLKAYLSALEKETDPDCYESEASKRFSDLMSDKDSFMNQLVKELNHFMWHFVDILDKNQTILSGEHTKEELYEIEKKDLLIHLEQLARDYGMKPEDVLESLKKRMKEEDQN